MAEDLESVGVLAVLEAKYEEQGKWTQFAVCVAQNRIRDEVRRVVKYNGSRVLYDALSSTETVSMLRKHSMTPAINGEQDENAYLAQFMNRLVAPALGKALFVESLSGKVTCAGRTKARSKKAKWRIERRALRALEKTKEYAARLVSEDV